MKRSLSAAVQSLSEVLLSSYTDSPNVAEVALTEKVDILSRNVSVLQKKVIILGNRFIQFIKNLLEKENDEMRTKTVIRTENITKQQIEDFEKQKSELDRSQKSIEANRILFNQKAEDSKLEINTLAQTHSNNFIQLGTQLGLRLNNQFNQNLQTTRMVMKEHQIGLTRAERLQTVEQL